MSKQIAICGWRGRTLFDAYLRLPDGMGTLHTATESYVDLVESRGLSLPKTEKGWRYSGPACGVRSELYRMSSDASHYENGGWNHTRPDWFRRYDEGIWGLREEIYLQAKNLDVNGQSLIAGFPPIQNPSIPANLFFLDKPTKLDRQQIYAIQMLDPNLEIGKLMIKFGRGIDPEQRVRELQTGCPYPLIVRWAMSGRGTARIENKIHKRLEANREEGEWFLVSIEEINQVASQISEHNMMII